MKVAVLGASPKPERYANKAVRALVEHGHDVVPIHPAHEEVEELPVRASVAELEPGEVHTVTVYLRAARSSPLRDDLVGAAPERVIFNPGAENEALADDLRRAGIEVEEACTLVLLSTGQFG